MAQHPFATIDPAETNGAELATDLNGRWAAMLSLHSGTTRPAAAVAGTMWIDTAGTPIWTIKVYDGAADISLFAVDTTGNTARPSLGAQQLPTVSTFAGDAAETAFVLSAVPVGADALIVTIDGIVQQKTAAWSLGGGAGKTVTFTAAPPDGSAIVVTDLSDTAVLDPAQVAAVVGLSDALATVSGDTAAINTVATDLDGDDDIGTVAANIADITTAASNIAAITAAPTEATNAAASAAAALASETAAGVARTAAETAETNAGTAQTAAESARDDAVVAKDAAETAEAGAAAAALAAVAGAAASAAFRTRFSLMPPFLASFVDSDVSALALTRATVGFTNTDGGEVESKAIDAVRLTHDASTGEPLGLLVEPAATNHHITSNSLNGNGVVRMTVTDDDAVAPDGTTTAGTMTETATTGSHAAGASAGKYTIASAGAYYCLSAYVKDVGANTTQHSAIIYSAPFNGVTANWHGWQWDFATETLTPYQPANENVTVGYEKFANGWYRLWATRAPTGASGSGGVGFSFQNDGSSYLGDTDNSMAMWGLMLEEVESLDAGPSSVILTDGSEVTRSADLATADLSTISAFRADGFSLLVEATILDGDGVLLSVGKTSTNEIALVMDAGDLTLTGADSLDLTAASGLTPGDRVVVALRVAENDVAISVDGATVVTDGTHSLNADADEMQFGANIDGSAGLPCIIRQVAVFGPLSNATLEAMSNG